VRGTIDRAQEVRMGPGGRMRSTEAWLSDDSGARVQLLWFNQPFMARSLHAGMEVAVSGTVSAPRRGGRAAFHNPELERLSDTSEGGGTHTGRMVPVYHLTEGIPQRRMRDLIAGLVERFVDRLEDPLPASMCAR